MAGAGKPDPASGPAANPAADPAANPAADPAANPAVDAARRAGRRLSAVCAVLLLAAIALAGAARLTWFTGRVDAVGRGIVAVTATGADLVPALSPLALLSAAGVAAAVALGGPLRRVLGGLLVAVGIVVLVMVGPLLLTPPTPADLAALPGAPAGGTPVPGSVALHVGPLVAVLGALLLLAAGVVLAVAEPRLARLGTRFAGRPASSPPPARPAADPAADPDRAAWDALDAGADPTVDPRPTERPRDAGERTDGGRPGTPV